MLAREPEATQKPARTGARNAYRHRARVAVGLGWMAANWVGSDSWWRLPVTHPPRRPRESEDLAGGSTSDWLFTWVHRVVFDEAVLGCDRRSVYRRPVELRRT